MKEGGGGVIEGLDADNVFTPTTNLAVACEEQRHDTFKWGVEDLN